MGVGYIWAIILGVGICFLPESPRWDYKKGFAARAHSSMAKFYGVPGTHNILKKETDEITQAIEASSGHHPWHEAITGPRMLYRILLGMGLQMFQQLTGANYFFYYGTTIFYGVGISNSYVTAMILGGVNFGTTFIGLYLVEKYGRRKCLAIGGLCQFICFIVFASIGHFKFEPAVAGSSDKKTSGYVMIVSLLPSNFSNRYPPNERTNKQT